MTFAEYNTDKNFDNDKSSLDELVKIGLSEGKTSDEIKSSLSPKWQKSKKIGEFDNYVTKYSTPKKEEKPAEVVKETVKTETPKTTEESTGIKQSDKNYMNDINAILNEEQKQELQKLSKTSVDAYNRTMDNMQRSGEAFKTIDDHFIEQLPTFMFKRFENGEFGDPKSQDAQLRLVHFMVNGLQSKLKNAANVASIVAGKGQMFSDTTSDYEKYQATNLEEGMANRWNKYKQDTQAAIDLVKQRNINEEDALNIINKISMNDRLQNAYNMADANKKAYMIEVLSKIGDKVSNWNDTKFVNALIGAEMTGEDIGNAAALIGTRAGEKILDNFNLIDENGNLNLSALKNIKDLPGIKEAFSKFGIDLDNVDFETAGFGGSGKTDSNGNETNLTGNIQNYKTIGGKVVSFDFNDPKAGEKIQGVYDDLIKRYKNGEIDAATFKEYYDPMYVESKKHPGSFKTFFSSGSDEAIRKADVAVRVEVSDQIDALNEQAKNGEIKPSDYNEKFKALKDKAQKYGASEKDLKSIDKGKVSDEKILRATEKKNKKK